MVINPFLQTNLSIQKAYFLSLYSILICDSILNKQQWNLRRYKIFLQIFIYLHKTSIHVLAMFQTGNTSKALKEKTCTPQVVGNQFLSASSDYQAAGKGNCGGYKYYKIDVHSPFRSLQNFIYIGAMNLNLYSGLLEIRPETKYNLQE